MDVSQPPLPPTQAPLRPPARPGGATVLVLALVAAAYFVSLGNGFVFDDQPQIVNPNVPWRGISSLGGVWPAVSGEMRTGDFGAVESRTYRPFFWISFLVDYNTLGRQPDGEPFAWRFHWTNIALHLLNVFLLTRLLAGLGATPRAALVGALIWGLHPAHTEVVAWVSGRADSLAAAFVFTALICWRGSLDARRHGGLLLSVLAGVAGLAGLMCKETAVAAPVLGLAAALLAPLPGKRRWALAALLPLFLAAGGYTWWRLSLLSPVVSDAPLSVNWSGFLDQLPLLAGAYAQIIALPLLPSIERSQDLASAGDFCFGLGVGLLCLVAILLVLCVRRRRPGAVGWLGVAWFLIALGPVSGLIPFYTVLAERYLYLPLAGLALLVVAPSWWAAGSLKRSLVADLVLVGYLFLAGLLVFARCHVYQNDQKLYEISLETSPGSYVLHTNLGAEYRRQADARRGILGGVTDDKARSLDAKAREQWVLALGLNGRYAPALHNMGCLLKAEGDLATAGSHFALALESRPWDPDPARELLAAARALAASDPERARAFAAAVAEHSLFAELKAEARELVDSQVHPDL